MNETGRKMKSQVVDLDSTTPVIAFNVNGEKLQLKTEIASIAKSCLWEIQFKREDTETLKVRRWEGIQHRSPAHKEAGAATFMRDKQRCKTRNSTEEKGQIPHRQRRRPIRKTPQS